MSNVIDYDVVSEVAGHQSNKGVPILDAAKDIFGRVKEKSMQLSINGEFIQFDNVKELEDKLQRAAIDNCNVRVYDEIIGG